MKAGEFVKAFKISCLLRACSRAGRQAGSSKAGRRQTGSSRTGRRQTGSIQAGRKQTVQQAGSSKACRQKADRQADIHTEHIVHCRKS